MTLTISTCRTCAGTVYTIVGGWYKCRDCGQYELERVVTEPQPESDE